MKRRKFLKSCGAAGVIGIGVTTASCHGMAQNALDASNFGAKGDGRTDDTAALARAIAAARKAKGTLHLRAGVYSVSTLLLEGEGYSISTSAGVIFRKRRRAVVSDDLDPILLFRGARQISLGDARFVGNLGSDRGEYSPAIAVLGCRDIKLGALYGENICGDVLYVHGTRIAPSYNIVCTSVSGRNVFRNLVSLVGGQLSVGQVINDGPVGFRDISVEPNSGAYYQPCELRVDRAIAGSIDVVSGDPDLQNISFFCGDMDLDGNRVRPTTPPYPASVGGRPYAFALHNCRDARIARMKLRNYDGFAVTFAESHVPSTLTIDLLDIAACARLEKTYQAIFVQHGKRGVKALRIGELRCVHTARDRWVIHCGDGLLDVTIDKGTISGGLVAAHASGHLSNLNVDCAGGDGVILAACSGLTLHNASFTGAQNATLLYDSSNCRFEGVRGNFRALARGRSRGNVAIDSSLNGPTRSQEKIDAA